MSVLYSTNENNWNVMPCIATINIRTNFWRTLQWKRINFRMTFSHFCSPSWFYVLLVIIYCCGALIEADKKIYVTSCYTTTSFIDIRRFSFFFNSGIFFLTKNNSLPSLYDIRIDIYMDFLAISWLIVNFCYCQTLLLIMMNIFFRNKVTWLFIKIVDSIAI